MLKLCFSLLTAIEGGCSQNFIYIARWAMMYATKGITSDLHLRQTKLVDKLPIIAQTIATEIKQRDIAGRIASKFSNLYSPRDPDDSNGKCEEAEDFLIYLEYGLVKYSAMLEYLRKLGCSGPEIDDAEKHLEQALHVFQPDQHDPDRQEDEERLGAIFMALTSVIPQSSPGFVEEFVGKLREYKNLPPIGVRILEICKPNEVDLFLARAARIREKTNSN